MIYFSLASFDTDEVIVAVIDTGINEKMLKEESTLTGFDFVDYDWVPNDEVGHGTMMAEIIKKTAPNSYILPIKFIKGSESKTIYRPFAIFYSIIKGADIVNMSFNGDGDFLTKQVIKYGKSKGVIFVGASGNKGEDDIEYPAKYNDVISVGGFVPFNNSFYGSYGRDLNFVAPAVYQGEYNRNCQIGTSISAAYLSGVIADIKYTFPDMTNEKIQKYLCEHSKKIYIKDSVEIPYIDIKKISEIKSIDTQCYLRPLEGEN